MEKEGGRDEGWQRSQGDRTLEFDGREAVLVADGRAYRMKDKALQRASARRRIRDAFDFETWVELQALRRSSKRPRDPAEDEPCGCEALEPVHGEDDPDAYLAYRSEVAECANCGRWWTTSTMGDSHYELRETKRTFGWSKVDADTTQPMREDGIHPLVQASIARTMWKASARKSRPSIRLRDGTPAKGFDIDDVERLPAGFPQRCVACGSADAIVIAVANTSDNSCRQYEVALRCPSCRLYSRYHFDD